MGATRRTFIKGLGIGGLVYAANDLWQSLQSDDHFHVALFVTEETANHGRRDCDNELVAAKRTKTWIEGVFDHPNNPYSVTVTVSETIVEPPTEDPYEVLDWWKGYHKRNDPDVVAEDSNLLITTSKGGKAYPGGQYGTVGYGNYLPNLEDTYHQFGEEYEHRAMIGVLHELGHNLLPMNTYYLLTALTNQDDLHVTHHDLGTTVEDPDNPGWYGRTPMLYENEQNNCGCNEHTDKEPDGWALFYADCMLRHIP